MGRRNTKLEPTLHCEFLLDPAVMTAAVLLLFPPVRTEFRGAQTADNRVVG